MNDVHMYYADRLLLILARYIKRVLCVRSSGNFGLNARIFYLICEIVVTDITGPERILKFNFWDSSIRNSIV